MFRRITGTWDGSRLSAFGFRLSHEGLKSAWRSHTCPESRFADRETEAKAEITPDFEASRTDGVSGRKSKVESRKSKAESRKSKAESRSGDRIPAPCAKRLASEEPLRGQPAPLQHPVPLDGLHGVLGAGGMEPAHLREERGDAPLVDAQEGDRRP